MGTYDSMQVCMNGHMITSHVHKHPEDLRKFCQECGEKTIVECPECSLFIPGHEDIPGLAYPGPSEPPDYCHGCGSAYPWTKPKSLSTEPDGEITSERSNKIFIVHGHDEELKQIVARTVSDLGLEPVILHEQPDRGRTVIEKFVDYSDVGFAIVLLTPDDLVLPPKPWPKHIDIDNIQTASRPRARQNVIAELGFFIGKLGRSQVMALKKGKELEVPSDFAGVLYKEYDRPDGKWRTELVQELKAAGYKVSADSLIKV